MKNIITFQGKPLSLSGRSPRAGSAAPGFEVTSQDMEPVRLADFAGKIKLISTFPSLDTPVCDLQVKEFNRKAAGFSSDIAVIGISKDLPFAQKRFCSENGIRNETVLSDYRTSSFGMKYGLLIKELNLLARAVLIIDKNDTLRYFQVVPELARAPDYDAALRALDEVVKAPAVAAMRPFLCPCQWGRR